MNFSGGNFEKILTGVPETPILGPLLFNFDLCYQFYDIEVLNMVCSTDDNTPYTSSEVNDAFIRLENCPVKIFEWCCKNRFKSNVDKCNLITTSKSQEEIPIGETSLMSVNIVKQLVIHIHQVNFDY